MLLPPAGIGEFTVRYTEVAAVGAGFQLVADASASRVALIFGSGAGYNLAPAQATATTGGLHFTAFDTYQVLWSTHGGLVNVAWYAEIAGTSVNVIEVLYRPSAAAPAK